MKMIPNVADGPIKMNLATLQTVTEEYIIEYLKTFIPSYNIKRSTTTINSFTSTQRRTTRKLVILKYIIIATTNTKIPLRTKNPLRSKIHSAPRYQMLLRKTPYSPYSIRMSRSG